MRVTVQFYSYFKDLTGCENCEEAVPAGTTVGQLHRLLIARHPKLDSMQRSTLIAVGLEYAAPDQALKEGDQVSLFPPVQGG